MLKYIENNSDHDVVTAVTTKNKCIYIHQSKYLLVLIEIKLNMISSSTILT